ARILGYRFAVKPYCLGGVHTADGFLRFLQEIVDLCFRRGLTLLLKYELDDVVGAIFPHGVRQQGRDIAPRFGCVDLRLIAVWKSLDMRDVERQLVFILDLAEDGRSALPSAVAQAE